MQTHTDTHTDAHCMRVRNFMCLVCVRVRACTCACVCVCVCACAHMRRHHMRCDGGGRRARSVGGAAASFEARQNHPHTTYNPASVLASYHLLHLSHPPPLAFHPLFLSPASPLREAHTAFMGIVTRYFNNVVGGLGRGMWRGRGKGVGERRLERVGQRRACLKGLLRCCVSRLATLACGQSYV